jgi:hypothetical protein
MDSCLAIGFSKKSPLNLTKSLINSELKIIWSQLLLCKGSNWDL